MRNQPDVRIYVIRCALSDGSHVFNVTLGETELPAVSERDALQLADKIAEAINEHTVQTAAVRFDRRP